MQKSGAGVVVNTSVEYQIPTFEKLALLKQPGLSQVLPWLHNSYLGMLEPEGLENPPSLRVMGIVAQDSYKTKFLLTGHVFDNSDIPFQALIDTTGQPGWFQFK